jgi:hypothetical protein
MSVWEWFNTNSGAVQAIATVVLVVVTAVYVWLTLWLAMASREQIRLSVLPHLEPNGDVRVLGGNLLVVTRKYSPDLPEGHVPFSTTNIGRGPAIGLQWEIGFAPPRPEPAVVRLRKCLFSLLRRQPIHDKSSGRMVPRSHTFLSHLGVGDTERLWHTRDSQQGNFPIDDRMQVVIWYDDVLGNHYCSTWTRHGDRWDKTTKLIGHRASAVELEHGSETGL